VQYPIWIGAVGEAIYTLGAERNGDIVIGASYAPGFQNLNNFQWGVSLLNISITADWIRHVTLTCIVA
jgi:alpha-N-arabinofuranosidase